MIAVSGKDGRLRLVDRASHALLADLPSRSRKTPKPR